MFTRKGEGRVPTPAPLDSQGGLAQGPPALAGEFEFARRRRRNRPGNAQAKGPRKQVKRWKAAGFGAPKEQGRTSRLKSLRLQDSGGVSGRLIPPARRRPVARPDERPDPAFQAHPP